MEAVKSLAANRARTIATALGTVVGVAALVAIVGVASTAERQVSDQFDLLEATEVLARIRTPSDTTEAEERVRRIEHVNAVGSFGSGGIVDVSVLRVDSQIPNVEVVYATADFFDAREVSVRNGRIFDSGHVARDDRVTVLGADLAIQLGVTTLAVPHRAVLVGDTTFEVIGVIDGSDRMPSLARSLVLPLGERARGLVGEVSVVALTDLGFASGVADVLGLALAPHDPDRAVVVAPPRPRDFAVEVEEDVGNLVVGAGLLALVLGAMGIAGATAVSVVERTSEIGLRLALGAKRSHIAIQVLIESSVVGLWSGVIGAAAGVVAIVGVASVNEWQPLADPLLLVGGPLIGLIVGLLAGLVPAWRAASIAPDRALRTE